MIINKGEFDIDEFDDTWYSVETEDGYPVSILCIDANCEGTPIIGLVHKNGGDVPMMFEEDGTCRLDPRKNLVMVTKESEDGDILFDKAQSSILIASYMEYDELHYHCLVPESGKILFNDYICRDLNEITLATEEQKKTLFSRLKEAGYQWNDKTKNFTQATPETLKDTVDLMLSKDFKDRLKAEYYQLNIRLKSLYKAIYESPNPSGLSAEIYYGNLKTQYNAMVTYQNILIKRILDLGIEL